MNRHVKILHHRQTH